MMEFNSETVGTWKGKVGGHLDCLLQNIFYRKRKGARLLAYEYGNWNHVLSGQFNLLMCKSVNLQCAFSPSD